AVCCAVGCALAGGVVSGGAGRDLPRLPVDVWRGRAARSAAARRSRRDGLSPLGLSRHFHAGRRSADEGAVPEGSLGPTRWPEFEFKSDMVTENLSLFLHVRSRPGEKKNCN